MGKTMELYETHLKGNFSGIDALSTDELSFLLAVHDKKVDYFKEERKMHFLAFMLVTLLFFIILPRTFEDQYRLAFVLVEALLFVLMVPYIFYYAWYENRLRKLESLYFVIFEAASQRGNK
ncbi:MAG: hypothetical protein JW765_03650 [Deltaproteobacteria bacterium]|nr:hypothetical protein [Candidatus Zymogenaceae bacterium]